MPSPLDLALAWRRTKADLQANRVFVRMPYEIELVEENLDGWLNQLDQKISAGYHPSSAPIADVPKGNGAVRPAAILSSGGPDGVRGASGRASSGNLFRPAMGARNCRFLVPAVGEFEQRRLASK